MPTGPLSRPRLCPRNKAGELMTEPASRCSLLAVEENDSESRWAVLGRGDTAEPRETNFRT